MNNKEYSMGGSAFWILLIGVAITTLFFLLLWSYHHNSIKGVVIAVIFLLMILTSIVFSRFKIFDLSTWGNNSLFFTIGFIIWGFVGAVFGGQSIISVSKNALFATISSELPQIMEFSLNGILIPIAEEVFWMIALPFFIISFMNAISKKVSFFNNKFFQFIMVIIVGGSTFALFHVGKWFITFIISALAFRTLMILLVIGDKEFDTIKKHNVVTAFSVGAHMANNISTYGFSKALLLLSSNFFPVGLLVMLFFGIILLSGLEKFFRMIMGRGAVA